MTVTPTANKSLNEITVASEQGTWGPYVNASIAALDNMLAGTAVIPLSNSNVVLSSAQYQCNNIVFTGALGSNINITLPAVGSFYSVQNLTTNTSVFQVVLGTTASGGQVIGIPPGESVGIMTDGVNTLFRSLGRRVGTFVDFASSGIPAWISACSVPPYLNCDGSAFSPLTYPILAGLLGGSNTPLCSGSFRVSQNDGRFLITTLGNPLGSLGGTAANTLSLLNTNWAIGNVMSAAALLGGSPHFAINNVPPSPQATFNNMPPYIVHGITMIRAG